MIWDVRSIFCGELPLIPPPSRREIKGLYYKVVFLSRLDYFTVIFGHFKQVFSTEYFEESKGV
jgi:hypothetical protein